MPQEHDMKVNNMLLGRTSGSAIALLQPFGVLALVFFAACGGPLGPEGSHETTATPEAPASGDIQTQEHALRFACSGSCNSNEVFNGYHCHTGCPGYGTCIQSGGWNSAICSPLPNIVASITAQPNTVYVPQGTLGSANICWTLSELHDRKVWIKVSVNGGGKQIFNGERDSGTTCIVAPWIQGGNSYMFTVETNQSSDSVIANTTVAGVVSKPPPRPLPSGCPPNRDHHCGPRVCWPIALLCP